MTLKPSETFLDEISVERCPKPQMGNIYELISCSVKAEAAAECFYSMIQ